VPIASASTASQSRILCLGHAAHDLIYRVSTIPTRPVKVVAKSMSESGGGMAANAAVAISRLGGVASYWGRVADDLLGERILADLAREGVDVSGARRVPGARSPCTSILVSDEGERLICSFSDPSLDPDPGWLPQARVSHFDVVMADVRWPRGAALVLDLARRLDRPALLDADVAPPEVAQQLAAHATHVLYSEAGLEVVAPGEPHGEALRRLQHPHHAVIGVTLGAGGFLWRDREYEHHVPAPAVEPVDTLAAGDVWHGAFALALAERQPVRNAVVFANAAAALKCLRPGGRSGAPSRDEVERMLSKTSK
jgi:sulfofructose kinase